MKHAESVPGTPLTNGNGNGCGTPDESSVQLQVNGGESVPGTPGEPFRSKTGTVLPSLDGNSPGAGRIECTRPSTPASSRIPRNDARDELDVACASAAVGRAVIALSSPQRRWSTLVLRVDGPKGSAPIRTPPLSRSHQVHQIFGTP
jgi:hypothetical protein